MSVIALYESTVLQKSGKKGDLKKDGEYYEIVVGAFDCLNSREELYIFNNNIKRMYDPGGSFHRRMHKAVLRGEVEHPEFKPGMSLDQYLNRIRQIPLTNSSHHFRQIRLESGKDENGKPIVLAIGSVRKSGEKGHVFQDAIDNREENVCFSIRAMSKRWNDMGQVKREITSVITYDLVGEGGILCANKYDTPSMECFSQEELPFTEADLVAAEAWADKLEEKLALESEPEVSFTMIRSAMGWQKVQKTKMRAMDWR
ncbi:virion structural protein [Vibrio phage BONAISHI]|nr:virion structural protein [Vibrio phage BONAISHI]